MSFCTKCSTQLNVGDSFCSKCGAQIDATAQVSSTAGNQIPIFTPPSNAAPMFTPPQQRYSEHTCYYHQNEKAMATCERCGKNLCYDCYKTYGVSEGNYAGQALCYDCTKQMVTENVTNIKKIRTRTIADLIVTILFLIYGCVSGSALAVKVGGVAGIILFPIIALYAGSIYTTYKMLFKGLFEIDSILGYIIFCFKFQWYGIIAPYLSIKNLIQRFKQWKQMNLIIESDTESINQLTLHLNESIKHHDEASSQSFKRCAASIAANGEILRNFI